MVRQHDWYDPSVMKRVRIAITIVLWAIGIIVLYLNHNWLITAVTNFFKQL